MCKENEEMTVLLFISTIKKNNVQRMAITFNLFFHTLKLFCEKKEIMITSKIY